MQSAGAVNVVVRGLSAKDVMTAAEEDAAVVEGSALDTDSVALALKVWAGIEFDFVKPLPDLAL